MKAKKKYNGNWRTDLISEEVAYFNKDLEGIKNTKTIKLGLTIQKTKVNKKHDPIINKKAGIYYTIDLNDLDIHDHDVYENVTMVVAEVLVKILKNKKVLNQRGMIVGLGNKNVTPDSLGPYVLEEIIVTRHLVKNNLISDGYSDISGYAPGVMGNTGIETADIIKGIYDLVDADYLIVIDALATSDAKRINHSIQLTDTGISPGSGVGAKHKEISEATLKIPVIAIGIPTVVDASSLAFNLLERIYKDDVSKIEELEQKMTKMNLEQMMVTPKEIDAAIIDLSRILSSSINIAVHPKIRKAYLNL